MRLGLFFSLSPSPRHIRWLVYKIPLPTQQEDASKNAASFESPLGSFRNRSTQRLDTLSLSFSFFFSSLRLFKNLRWWDVARKKVPVSGNYQSAKERQKKIKFIFVITLNRSGPESLRTDSLAFFSILSKRVINKGKVSVWRGNFPTPTQKRRCVCMCRDSIHVLLVPPNHKKRKGPSLSRPYNKILWDLSPLVVIFQRIYPEKIQNKINK